MGKRAVLLGLAALFLSAAPASAQYFGRNKVQHETFEFQVLQTPHFDIHYYPAEHDAALYAAAMAERWYARLSRALDHALTERTPIVLYASHAHFTQTTVLAGVPPEGVGGFTDHAKGRVVVPFTASLGEFDRVLGHELVHAFQRDSLHAHGRSAAVLPLWFLEGMAEYLAIGEIDATTAMWIRDAVDAGQLPAIRQLHQPRWFPYRYGQALWAFLANEFGEDVAARALASSAKGGAIGRLQAVTGVKESALTARWHAALRSGVTAVTPGVQPTGEPLITRRQGGGRLNVGPALSPDGAHLVFLSERDRYSVDLFLADAKTGKIRRKIVGTAGNARFDSVQFVNSAGAWDPSSTRFALAALRGGAPVLTVLRLPAGGVEHEQTFRDLDQIFDPSWSPDGRRVAFAGLRGGMTDLYVVDLPTRRVERLTQDVYADLQPAWSPDGRTLAFTTDRFTSSIDDLTFGAFHLGTLDLESGTIRELPSVGAARHIDPQWSGSALYFVADAGGVSNVYRMDVAAGTVRRITDERNGVTGITATSPALSVAPDGGRLAYSVYRRGSYEIRTIAVPAGVAVATSDPERVAPRTTGDPERGAPRTTGDPERGAPRTTGDPERGAPRTSGGPAAALTPTKYRGGMSLNGFSQPYLSAGGGALGSFFRAGTSLSFSDLLEQRLLQVAFQVGTRVRDFALETAYVNKQSRWSWGVVGAHLPATFVRAQSRRGAPSTIARETAWRRQTHRQAMALAAYPFSRVRRLEVSGGVHAISFVHEIETRRYSRATGALIDTAVARAPAPEAVVLAEAAATLVYDSSVAGPTAPVLGRRSRFEVAPTTGDLSFVTVTADYRRYMMPASPLTVALRVRHVGRYGRDAADERLLPLLWTLRDLVRGFTVRDAPAAQRFVVGNVELRAPLVGPMGWVRRSSPLPIDAFLFADAGAFASPHATAHRHPTLGSLGGGARLNAAGFVFEVAAARALDHSRGWTLAANFRPGF